MLSRCVSLHKLEIDREFYVLFSEKLIGSDAYVLSNAAFVFTKACVYGETMGAGKKKGA